MNYYHIDEQTARTAHEMASMSDYSENRATNEYRASVDKAAALVESKKKTTSQYYHAKLDDLLDRYARRLAEWTNAYNRNGASCPSVLVCGAGNFLTRKKARQNAREDKLWQEYKEIQSILDKIKSIGTGPVDLADPNAREILTEKLQRLQKELDDRKAMNAHYRKHGSFSGFPGLSADEAEKISAEFEKTKSKCPWIDKPFPSYELASLRGKIKRVRARLDELDKLNARRENPDQEEKHDGFWIVRNAEQNRLQILFDEKPDDKTREALKAHGFRWSPKNGVWQRQLTQNAERAARIALGLN